MTSERQSSIMSVVFELRVPASHLRAVGTAWKLRNVQCRVRKPQPGRRGATSLLEGRGRERPCHAGGGTPTCRRSGRHFTSSLMTAPATENPRVGGSIPPLATIPPRPIDARYLLLQSFLRRNCLLLCPLLRGAPTSRVSRGLWLIPLACDFKRPPRALHAAFTLMGPEFMRAEPSWQPRPAQ